MKLSSHQEALAAINSLHGSQTMPVSIILYLSSIKARYFFIFRSTSSADDRQSSCSRTSCVFTLGKCHVRDINGKEGKYS